MGWISVCEWNIIGLTLEYVAGVTCIAFMRFDQAKLKRGLAMVRYLLLILLSLTSLISHYAPTDDSYERESKRWRSKSGTKEIIANFVKLEKNKLHLIGEDGKQFSTSLENLFPADAGKAVYLAGELDDLRQLESIRSTFDVFLNSPQAGADGLEEAHRKFDRAPYAGLAASIVIARDLNDPVKAGRVLGEVISRLETIRTHQSDRHINTLTTAYNNRAIVHMKERAFTKACVSFINALEVSADHEVGHVVHNASLVLGWAAQNDKAMQINDAIKKKLVLALQERGISGSRGRLTEGRLCYCLNYDRAMGSGVYEPQILDFAVVEDNCIICGGDGVLDCRNCKDGVSTYKDIEVVTYDPVRQGPVMREVNREKPCDVCNRYWGSLPKRGLLPCPYPECDNGKLRAPVTGR